MLSSATLTTVPRATLATVFKDPKLRDAIEQALATVQGTPDAVNKAQATADMAKEIAQAATDAINALIASKGQPNGIAGLDADGLVPAINLPPPSITTLTTVSGLVSADDDAAAAAAGVPVGHIYCNGSVLQFRVS